MTHKYGGNTVQFMVIEHFRNRGAKAVYARFPEKGPADAGPDHLRAQLGHRSRPLLQVMECDDMQR
jgi:hypothetical protein